jgi:hypothetical protein
VIILTATMLRRKSPARPVRYTWSTRYDLVNVDARMNHRELRELIRLFVYSLQSGKLNMRCLQMGLLRVEIRRIIRLTVLRATEAISIGMT